MSLVASQSVALSTPATGYFGEPGVYYDSEYYTEKTLPKEIEYASQEEEGKPELDEPTLKPPKNPSLKLLWIIFSSMLAIQEADCHFCPSHNGIYPNINNCKCYFKCNDGIPLQKWCPPGQKFDVMSMSCTFPSKTVCAGSLVHMLPAILGNYHKHNSGNNVIQNIPHHPPVLHQEGNKGHVHITLNVQKPPGGVAVSGGGNAGGGGGGNMQGGSGGGGSMQMGGNMMQLMQMMMMMMNQGVSGGGGGSGGGGTGGGNMMMNMNNLQNMMTNNMMNNNMMVSQNMNQQNMLNQNMMNQNMNQDMTNQNMINQNMNQNMMNQNMNQNMMNQNMNQNTLNQNMNQNMMNQNMNQNMMNQNMNQNVMNQNMNQNMMNQNMNQNMMNQNMNPNMMNQNMNQNMIQDNACKQEKVCRALRLFITVCKTVERCQNAARD